MTFNMIFLKKFPNLKISKSVPVILNGKYFLSLVKVAMKE